MARVEDVAVNLVVTAGQQVLDDAVARRTREVVTALPPDAWAEIIGPADAARVPAWFRAFVGQSRAFELGTSAITHNAIHLGEAITVRGMAGFALGI